MTWIGIGGVVIGGATTIIGANKQQAANNKAIDANTTAQAEQNRLAWLNYLMSRGVNPTGNVQPGQIPGPGSYTPINTKLPLYATIQVPKARAVPQAPAGPTWRKRA